MQRRGAAQRQRQTADQSVEAVRAREAAAAFELQRFSLAEQPDAERASPAKRRRLDIALGPGDSRGAESRPHPA
jgi:hypothetical protein